MLRFCIQHQRPIVCKLASRRQTNISSVTSWHKAQFLPIQCFWFSGTFSCYDSPLHVSNKIIYSIIKSLPLQWISHCILQLSKYSGIGQINMVKTTLLCWRPPYWIRRWTNAITEANIFKSSTHITVRHAHVPLTFWCIVHTAFTWIKVIVT